MNVWLCPIKPKSWRIIKTFKVFGFPKRASKAVSKIKPDELIIFHVLKPTSGIIAICRVASKVYESHSNLWGKNRYPLRVKIDFIPGFLRDKNTTIPISLLFHKAKDSDEIRIEPYLRNIWITKITEEQYKRLEGIFKNRQAKRPRIST